MATGRDTQLTRQIGEHLVAAKLGRLGYIVSPFAGNVPLFDLLAADVRGNAIPIQVKAINGPSWQFRVDAFLEIEIVDDVQYIRGRKKLLNPDLLCIFILLATNEEDVFYIFQLKDLQEFFFITKVVVARRIQAQCIALYGQRTWRNFEINGIWWVRNFQRNNNRQPCTLSLAA